VAPRGRLFTRDRRAITDGAVGRLLSSAPEKLQGV
jgi:hypothetical protein